MTDQKKPEVLADDELETATGGFGSWGEPVGTFDGQRKKANGFGSWGTTGSTLKQPGTNMDAVNEDE